MDWRRGRASGNVVQAGGMRGIRRGGGFGLGGIAAVVLIGLLMGKSPGEILGFLVNLQGGGGYGGQQQMSAPEQSEQTDFVKAILGSTEDVWNDIFSSSGRQYPEPRLVLFSGLVDSACGRASSAVGPFYCPGDGQVYLDLQFFRDMQTRFRAAGDLARAYVIAHEVGHHVQNVMGVTQQVDRARRSGQAMEGPEGLSVRQELQADCLAGVWVNRAEARLKWLEQGDLESAMAAATAIGDDALQKQSRGVVVPDSFTHGSSAQRVRWFREGFESGQVSSCDTFRAQRL